MKAFYTNSFLRFSILKQSFDWGTGRRENFKIMGNYVYHYTDVKALEGILKKDNLCLWATRYDKLNDPNEFVWAKEKIIPILNELLLSDKQPLDNEYEFYPYVISLCKEPDCLTMWRLYANNGLGIQIELEKRLLVEETEKNCCLESEGKEGEKMPKGKKRCPDYFLPCRYANESNIHAELQAMKDDFQLNHDSDTNNDFYDMCAFIKTDDYEVEREFRYIRPNHDEGHFTPFNYETGGKWKENLDNVKYRSRENDFIPYQEVFFPKETLKEIVIGYAYKFDETKNYLEYLLKERGYDISKITIKKSKFYRQ